MANFPPAQLERLFAETDTVPAVNQIELHPRLPQAELREFNARHGIATQAWSPLGHGQLISDPTVATIAERHGRTAAQILLRWNLELGNAVISKSVTPKRIRSNMEIFDFELTSEDHTALRAASKSRDHGWVVRRHAETGVFASGMIDIAGGWGRCEGMWWLDRSSLMRSVVSTLL